MFIYIILAVILVVLALVYNRIVLLNTRVSEAWSDIDVQLKRRYDLIPNLVETVKGYAKHEKSLLEAIAKHRADALSSKSKNEEGALNSQITTEVGKLFAIAEDYPKLMASDNFLSLQKDLSEIENTIQSARKFYNGSVRDLNIMLDSFPTNIIGSLLGFKKQEFFQLENEGERNNVSVSV